MASQARSDGQIVFFDQWPFLAIFGDFWRFFGHFLGTASTVRHSAVLRVVSYTVLGVTLWGRFLLSKSSINKLRMPKCFNGRASS